MSLKHLLGATADDTGASVASGPRAGTAPGAMAPLRVGLVADLFEEGWHSMDLVAEMLAQHVPRVGEGAVSITTLRAPFVRLVPTVNGGTRPIPERVVNRFWRYPRWLSARTTAFDVFHVADHSYAHLVHLLPPGRTVVFCHDIDAFSAVHGEGERGSRLPRFLTERVLTGLRAAGRVFCISDATRAAVERHALVDPARLRVVPLGVHPSCTPSPDHDADARAASLLGPGSFVDLLHVGSTIERKRIDVLLHVVAAVRRETPAIRLLRAGGAMTGAQWALARSLGLDGAILELPPLDRATLSAVYRRARLTLLPSAREGFGLPIAESLACGTPVVASDIDVCREVGGNAVTYRVLADVDGWARSVLDILDEAGHRPAAWEERRRRGMARASAFSWEAVARASVATYRELVESC